MVALATERKIFQPKNQTILPTTLIFGKKTSTGPVQGLFKLSPSKEKPTHPRRVGHRVFNRNIEKYVGTS